MSLKDHPAVVVIPIVVAVAGLFFTIGYNMRGDRIAALETQVKTLQLAQELKLPQLLASLRSAAEETRNNLATVNELKLAKKSVSELKRALGTSQQENSRLKGELEAKQKLLASIAVAAESFTLQEGKARNLAGYGVVVGLIDVHPIYKQATVMVNSEKLEMYPGAIKTIESTDKIYRLIVDAVDDDESSASFTLTVINKAANPANRADG